MSNVRNLKPVTELKRRVLVVEDNLDSVHSMAMLVKMMGHEVQFAINGFAALDIARTFRPDIILLDIGLPDFNGCEIVRQRKSEQGTQTALFRAISTPPPQRLKHGELARGCHEFYPRPIEPRLLERLL